jgi:hypothetical protein
MFHSNSFVRTEIQQLRPPEGCRAIQLRRDNPDRASTLPTNPQAEQPNVPGEAGFAMDALVGRGISDAVRHETIIRVTKT